MDYWLIWLWAWIVYFLVFSERLAFCCLPCRLKPLGYNSGVLTPSRIIVILTRRDDRTLDLQPRVDIAEQANANLFVSIHANAISLSRPDVNGIESYYFSDAGRRLAAVIHSSMLSATGMRNRGLKRSRFYVLTNTSMPATLLEVGFVTGVEDAPRLADPQWRTTMAGTIAQGILQYIQQDFWICSWSLVIGQSPSDNSSQARVQKYWRWARLEP